MSAKKDLSGEKNIPTHVVAVFGIVQKGNKYLIARRKESDPQAGGEWSVPSGKVEKGGGNGILEETLKREILEEVGIKVQSDIKLLANGSFIRVSGHSVIALTFLCKWKSGVARPLEDQDEVLWLTLPQIKRFKMPFYTKERFVYLDKYLKKGK